MNDKLLAFRKATLLAALISTLLFPLHADSTPPFAIQAAPGWVIFDAKKGGAYHYGPSLIINPDHSIDAWFASPGGRGPDGQHQWDWIRYRHSADGGRTWTPDEVVLKPTAGSRDRQSVCDPGAIRIGAWYYLGVTAVEDPKGHCNEVFVARAPKPDGPFEKWNGTTWGGSPQPILPFRSPPDVWGLGEPSFVVKGDTLFIYYTRTDRDPHGDVGSITMVATAPAHDPDWPAHVTPIGKAFDRQRAEDSADVKFDDTYNLYVAVSSAMRLTSSSYLNYRWSTDGIHFSDPSRITGALMSRAHNMGISGTPDGHIDHAETNFIAYAYSTGERPGVSWAYWSTYLNPIRFAP
jgi:hypothetical protein